MLKNNDDVREACKKFADASRSAHRKNYGEIGLKKDCEFCKELETMPGHYECHVLNALFCTHELCYFYRKKEETK